MIAPNQTTSVPALLSNTQGSIGDKIEVSAEMLGLAQDVGIKILKSGNGAALFIDYGKEGNYSNSLQVILILNRTNLWRP